MAISLRSISAAWILGVGSGATWLWGHLIYNTANPTGSQWLSSSGYTFNPPRLTSYKSKENDCLENLFKEESGFKEDKVYGCRVTGIDIWNDESQTLDYLTWTDRIIIRKGDEGRQIIQIIDNREDLSKYIQITTYKNKNGKWESEQVHTGAQGFVSHKDNSQSITCEAKKKEISKNEIVQIINRLQFKSNGIPWYQGKTNSAASSSITNDGESSSGSSLPEIFKESKFGSWIWVEDGASKESDIISKQFSWFTMPANERLVYKLKGCKQAYFDGPTELNFQDASAIHSLLTNIWKSKGKWVDTEEFCNVGYLRNLQGNQLEDLKLFCAKPITAF